MKRILTASLLLITALTASAQTVITGAEAGYLIDSEEEYLSGRLGFEFKANDSFSHQLELEVGYSKQEEFGIEADLLPVTANYRLVASGPRRLGWYVGAGAGFARTRLDGVSTGGPVKLRDESFAAQAFAGFSYTAGPSTTLTLGAKYIWVDDVTLASTSYEVGDDIALSAGVTFRF